MIKCTTVPQWDPRAEIRDETVVETVLEVERLYTNLQYLARH